MFLSRRVLSLGLRMTLKLMQDNVTSMQTLRSPCFSMQQSNFSLSKRVLAEMNTTVPLESDKSDKSNKQKSQDANGEEINKQELGKIQGKLHLAFTCKKCNTRNSKIISKHAYSKGVVVVRCDGCKNNHLIADNLGWFGNNGETRNIEVILKRKGESVRRIMDDGQGYFEAIAKEEWLRVQRLRTEAAENDVKVEIEEKLKVEYEKVKC